MFLSSALLDQNKGAFINYDLGGVGKLDARTRQIFQFPLRESRENDRSPLREYAENLGSPPPTTSDPE